MTKNYKSCYFLIISYLTIYPVQTVQVCNIKKFDKSFARLLTISNSGRKFPEQKGQDLNKYCDETERLIKDIELYKVECTSGEPKQLIGVMTFSIKNALNQLCRKSSKRLDILLAAAPCMNHNDNLVTACYTKIIDGILGAQNADEKKKIPFMCCELTAIFVCMDNMVSAPKCSEQHITAVSEFIRTIMGDTLNFMCGDYGDGSDKCDTLGTKPKKLKTQRRSKSFVIPVIDLLTSIPQK